MPAPRIGELLVAEGLLSPSAVDRAIGFQKAAAPQVRLGSILLTWDLIDEASLLQTLAAVHGCEPVTGEMLAEAPVDVVRMLPASHAVRLNAVAHALEKSRIRVAFVNPSDLAAIDEVSALTGHSCVPGVVTELRLLQAHRRFYGRAFPAELRPVAPRAEAGRASRAGAWEKDPASGAPRTIPVTAQADGSPPEDTIPLSIPDLPIPPAPSGRPTMPPAAPNPISDAEMGDLALAYIPEEFPRVVLLTVRDGAMAGWRGRGVDGAGVAALELSDDTPSLLAVLSRTGAPHFGRVDPEDWPQALARLLDGPPPCAVFPVHGAHGVVAILYADRRGAPMKFEDTGLLARAAAEIAALLARESSSRAVPTA